jgi:Zn-dependent protease
LMFLFAGNLRLIGWAKPTPVAGHNLKQLARGHVLVAAAGPVSNFLLALLFTAALALFIKVGLIQSEESPFLYIFQAGIGINVSLAVFNLLPVPPLDGSWIASWGLPRELGNRYDRIMEPYGYLVLLALYMTRVLDWIIGPPIAFVVGLLYRLAF